MTTPIVLPLDDERADLALAGGKGASLARLLRADLPVPDGFHITTHAYREFVAKNALQERILEASTGQEIADLFARHEMPPSLAVVIRATFDDMDASAVAVRSSATAEDLPDMSFAGQQDTFLNVTGDGLLDAVKRCWASLWTDRAIAYRRRNNVPQDEMALAVVVQEMVNADAAGVMFTVDPMGQDALTINAAWGLGEAVVGGQVTPDTIRIDRASRTITEKTVADKETMTVRGADGTREEPVPDERRRAPVLSDADAVRLARYGMEIEELYGRAMDIEWAARKGEFFIVQARPITGIFEEWNDSRTGESLWTSANLGEAIPDVMTPATWSLVLSFMDDALPQPTFAGYKGIGNIGGRFYLNLTIPVSLGLSLGWKSRLDGIKQVFGTLPPYEKIPRLPLSRWQMIKTVMGFAPRILKRIRVNTRRLPAFKETAAERCEALRAKAESASSAGELLRLWEQELRPYVSEANQMLQAAGRQGGTSLVMTRDKLHKMMGATDAEAMLTGVNTGGGLDSMGLLDGLGLLAKGEIDRETFAHRYGHRGPHEFEVSIPRPGEDPEWIDRQLAGLRDADTEDLLARQEEAREAAWTRFRERYPGKEATMRDRVNRWNAIVRDRETTRSEAMRAFWAMRAFILRAGALTEHGDDLFFLSIDEILDVLRGSAGAITKVPIRRATYERYSALPVYPRLIIGEFDPVRWAADPDRRSDIFDARGAVEPVADSVTGFPGAPGVVEGTARLIMHPDDGVRLKHGEILVTTVTNVGWTPMFPRAAAVVTDVGAPLSHASIVARKLGIPAVVGTGNATMRLHDGDRIRVDGERGTVEKLS